MTLVSMKLDPREARDSLCCAPDESDGPKYPYGLRIDLDHEALTKLGIDTLPVAGSTATLQAQVEVVTATDESTQEGRRLHLTLQITDLALQLGGDKTAAQKLYDRSNLNP